MCVCVSGGRVAAEVISLGVRLDHIPPTVFSCCGWGLVARLAGRKGGDGQRKERGREVGEVGMDMVKDVWGVVVERWAVPTVLTKAAQALHP